MFPGLKGKRVLITGAGSGIGAEMAKMFAKAEAKIGFHFRSSSNAVTRVQNDVLAQAEVVILKGNLLDRKVRENLVRDFVSTFGGIDVLINNAGACPEYKHFSDLSEEEWDQMFELHVKAPFALSKNAFAYMKKQKWGRIIFVSTASIKFGGVNNMHYYASKATMDAMMQGFAREGAKHNILVNSIRPGIIDTPMRTKTIGYERKRWKERLKFIPLGHPGEPRDVAAMALYLASEYGKFVTGEIFSIAGGE